MSGWGRGEGLVRAACRGRAGLHEEEGAGAVVQFQSYSYMCLLVRHLFYSTHVSEQGWVLKHSTYQNLGSTGN